MTQDKLKEKLDEWNACSESIPFVEECKYDLQVIWNICERGDWLLWLYNKLYSKNLRQLTLAKGHCVNTIRYLMKDERSIKAVDAAIAFGEGKITREELDAAASAAYDASAASAASTSAAYAAASAAYAAYSAAYAYAAASAAYAYTSAAYAYTSAAYAYTAARIKNQKETADICRKYLDISEYYED